MNETKNWRGIIYLMCAIQIGAGIAMIGVMAFLPLFLSTELGVSDPGEAAFWAGLISGVTPFMVAFSAPYWSIKADRYGPRQIMSVVLALVTCTAFLCTFTTHPWQLLALRLVQGLVGGFVPIGLSVVVTVTPEKETPWAMGYFQAAMVMGVMFGPLVGGIIADVLGYRMPFVVFGTLSLLCLLAVRFFMPDIRRKGRQETTSMWKELRYFMGIPRVRIMVFMQFLCNFGITGIGPILPLYIKNMIGADSQIVATIVGVIIFLSGGASAACSLSVGRLTARFSMHRLLIGATVFVGAMFVCQYLMSTVWGLGFFRAVTGFGMGLISPIANTFISKAVPPEKRGIVFGVVGSVGLMGNVVGPVSSGAIAMHFGYAAVFWSTAIAFWCAAAVIVYNFRHSDE